MMFFGNIFYKYILIVKTPYKFPRPLMKFMLIPVFILTIIGFACHTHRFDGELNQIDSLMVINDSMGSILADVDTVALLKARQTFTLNWKKINDILDSIEDAGQIRGNEYYTFITQYSNTDRSLKKHHRRFMRLSQLQAENGSQLKDLYASVKRNQIPEDSVPVYILNEASAVSALQQDVLKYMTGVRNEVQVLDSLHQYASEAIASYRKTLKKMANKSR